MDELFRNAPDIIRSAATNPLALSALVVLTLGVLAFMHFRSASEVARVTVFILTGLALLIIIGLAFISTLLREEFASYNQSQQQPTISASTEAPPAAAVTPAEEQAPAYIPEPTSDPALATSCVTPFLTCPFQQPFLAKGEDCTCVGLDGLLVWEGVAQ